jgi:tetratricopeptide (TPR) repeat protein
MASRKLTEGDRLMQEKKFREASFAFQEAASLDSSNIEAQFKLGNAYALLGYYAQAIERWGRVAQLSSDPGVRRSAEDNIARAQQKMAQTTQVSPTESAKIPGTGPMADAVRAEARRFYEQAVQLIGQRRYGDALAALNECLRREPALAVGYIARGSSLIGLRRFPEAVTDYQYSLRLDPNLASPLYGLAEAYRGMNRLDESRQHYTRYVSSQSPDVRAELQADARAKLEQLR